MAAVAVASFRKTVCATKLVVGGPTSTNFLQETNEQINIVATMIDILIKQI